MVGTATGRQPRTGFRSRHRTPVIAANVGLVDAGSLSAICNAALTSIVGDQLQGLDGAAIQLFDTAQYARNVCQFVPNGDGLIAWLCEKFDD